MKWFHGIISVSVLLAPAYFLANSFSIELANEHLDEDILVSYYKKKNTLDSIRLLPGERKKICVTKHQKFPIRYKRISRIHNSHSEENTIYREYLGLGESLITIIFRTPENCITIRT